MTSRFAIRADARIAATVAAATMTAHQVAGKATRDALFFTHFDVAMWAFVQTWSPVVSIAVAIAGARVMAQLGPGRLMPAAFAVSAALQLGIALLAAVAPAAAAIVFTVHMAAVGPVLISGYWSVFNESFDPRSARRSVGRLGGIATLGGVAGGVLAILVADRAGVTTLLPILALLHAACAVALGPLTHRTEPGADAEAAAAVPMLGGFVALRRHAYLRALASIVLLVTVSAMFIDFVFRSHATAAFPADRLMEVFSLFHVGVALLAFVAQIGLARLPLGRWAPAAAVAVLPASMTLAGLPLLALPGLATASIARGLEMVLGNSIFRSGYELLYTPVALVEKRATKALIDVGVARAGDALGGAATLGVLAVAVGGAERVLVVLAMALSALGLWVARRLHRGYVQELARNVKAGAARPEPGIDPDGSQVIDTRMIPLVTEFHSASIPIEWTRPLSRAALEGAAAGSASEPASIWIPDDPAHRLDADESGRRTIPPAPVPPPAAPAAPVPEGLDRVLARAVELRSGDDRRVRRALTDPEPMPLELVPHLIPLLATDVVAGEATRVLRRVAPRVIGQLVDALLDPEQPLDVRRRIPRILSACASERAVEGLLRGLDDVRFKVRVASGWGLARIHEVAGELPLDRERLLAAALREVAMDRQVWEGRRDLSRLADASEAPPVDDVIHERAQSSMQHVFTLLSLAVPEPSLLRMAFTGLQSDDPRRRGTALEYLEYVLPAEVREAIWPFLEERGRREGPLRTREEIISELVQTNESMRISIEELRRLTRGT